ncbi:MAG: hypothetical protein ACF8R7_12575 [Phycisphaerales bacterium JB039]
MPAVALYIAGGVVAAVGLAGVIWGAIGDRARGRRRCPRCFYPLPDGSRLCSECGHEAAGERRVLRTRRKWRIVGAGVALLALSAVPVGAGLVRQHGPWGWAPSGLVTRLLVIGEDSIDEEAITRVRAGRLTRAQAESVAVEAAMRLRRSDAKAVDTGLTLLKALARNSYVLVNDPPHAVRPMLEELRPELAMEGLLPLLEAEDPAVRDRAIALLSHYRDVDERALIEVVARLAADDTAEQMAARTALGHAWRESETVDRLPHPPEFVLQAMRGHYRPQSLATSDVDGGIEVISEGVAERRGARAALIDFALECAQDPEGITEQALGLWLYGHLAGFDERSRAMSLSLCGHEHEFLRAAAVRMLSVYEPDEEILAALDAALRGAERYGSDRSAASDVAASFGARAAELQPAFIEIGRRFGGSGSSAFIDDYRAIGGKPEPMLGALLDWLEEQGQGNTMTLQAVIDLEVRDPAAADRLRRHIEQLPEVIRQYAMHDDSIAFAAVAHAALGGDRTWATQLVLDRLKAPPKTSRYIIGSTDDAIVTLCRRKLADPRLIADRFLAEADPQTRIAGLQLLRWMGAEAAPVADRIAALRADPDPTVAADVEQTLDAVR